MQRNLFGALNVFQVKIHVNPIQIETVKSQDCRAPDSRHCLRLLFVCADVRKYAEKLNRIYLYIFSSGATSLVAMLPPFFCKIHVWCESR